MSSTNRSPFSRPPFFFHTEDTESARPQIPTAAARQQSLAGCDNERTWPLCIHVLKCGVQVERVFAHRMEKDGVQKVLIKWRGLPYAEATFEKLEDIFEVDGRADVVEYQVWACPLWLWSWPQGRSSHPCCCS